MRISTIAPLILIPFLHSAIAQTAEPVASESRDAATGYIGTMNFVVGRIGRDCLSLLGRTESPQQFAGIWQQRNSKYVIASGKYLERRLGEAYATGGQEKRDAVLREAASSARISGEATIQSWVEKDGKENACKRAVQLIDSGALDITPQSPMFPEIQALVDWAQQ